MTQAQQPAGGGVGPWRQHALVEEGHGGGVGGATERPNRRVVEVGVGLGDGEEFADLVDVVHCTLRCVGKSYAKHSMEWGLPYAWHRVIFGICGDTWGAPVM